MLYTIQDIKVLMMMCSLCQLGPFLLARSQIRCMPFINPFQYTASMGFFPYDAQNCQI